MTVKSRKNRWIFVVLSILLFICEFWILNVEDETIKDVLTSILAPFLIASIVSIQSIKMVMENKISEIENQLLDICVFIDTYDQLNEGEKYILDYLNNFNSKKYKRKKPLEKGKALIC